jgi:catechol 2,3-dioxygenase-like lactoylglutathione lyase family enzyme
MPITRIIPQLRTRDIDASIAFYTRTLGMTLDFRYGDFYAGLSLDGQRLHLKLADEKDPSIDYVAHGEHFHLYFQTDDITALAAELKANGLTPQRDVHSTDWGTREMIVLDDQGHTLYFAQPLDMSS